MNSDFEDIIYLFDNREEIVNEIEKSPLSVQTYLIEELQNLLNHPDINEGILAHLEPVTASQRTQRIIAIWNKIIQKYTA